MPGISSAPRSFYLPSLHSICSWKTSFSPHYEQTFSASRRWSSSYDAVPPCKRELFNKSGSELLASWAYPYAAPDRLRLCCDFLSLLFLVDGISDDQSGTHAAATGSVFLGALSDEMYDAATKFGRMVKDFRVRCLTVTSEASYNRLLRHVEEFVNSVTIEAELREKDVVLEEDVFTLVRRGLAGVHPMFGMFGCSLGLDLPDCVYDDPIFNSMLDQAADLVAVSNDIYSYNKEQSSGQYASNILTVFQKQKNVTLQEAVDHV